MEQFPRIRKNYFTVGAKVTRLPEQQGGRLEMFVGNEFGAPEMYGAFARCNDMRNPMALRDTLRPAEECIENELILKGYQGSALDKAKEDAIDNSFLGVNDWLWYDNFSNGVVSDAEPGVVMAVPTADEASQWFTAYRTLGDE